MLFFLLTLQVQSAVILGMTAADLQTLDQFSLTRFTLAGQSQVVSNLTTVGGCFPGSWSYVPDRQGYFFVSLSPGGGSEVVLINNQGKVLAQNIYDPPTYSVVLDNSEYDFNLKKFFINAYLGAEDGNYVMEWNPTSGSLTKIVKVPGVVQVSISTYCPVGHIFFLTLQLQDGGTGLVRVDTVGGKVFPSVTFDESDDPLIIMWDYKTATLWAWVATENYAAELITVDINTGRRLKTIISYRALTANGGTSFMDFSTKIVYSSLLDITNSNPTPVWVVVDTNSGNATVTPRVQVGVPINIGPIL